MGRVSKAKSSRINNLSQRPKKHARCASSASDSDSEGAESVPEVSEEDSDEKSAMSSFWVVLDDLETDDDADEEGEIDSDGEAEIHDEGGLSKFMVVLQEAQVVARKEEARNNRPQHYTGNSKRSKQRHALQRRKLAQDPNHQFITNFFKPVKRIRDEVDSCQEMSDEETIEVVEESTEHEESDGMVSSTVF